MKRSISIILCLVLAICLFCGCGATAMDSVASPAAPAEPAAPPMPMPEMSYDYGYEMKDSAEFAEPESPAAGFVSSGIPKNTKLIYTANMELETTSFDDSVAGLEELVNKMGGYFERSNVNNYGSYRSGNYTVRVPAENYDAFCSAAGQLCQLNYIDRSATDVSEAYYDTEARLETQKIKQERLQNLLAKAESMEDIIDLENALSETEYQIEQLTGTLRKYDSLVGYSTISIYLQEVYVLTEIEEPVIGFGAKLAEAFKRGTSNFSDGLQRAMLRVARHWVGWIVWLLIIAAVVVIVVRVTKKKRVLRKADTAPKIEDRKEDNKE
ncbi:MAG: DUF4349 domain-containing protein [Oscillospiraceae bacterium]|nr:DUF4349 domain-containing protein [Oscillospiraceae bacterium]